MKKALVSLIVAAAVGVSGVALFASGYEDHEREHGQERDHDHEYREPRAVRASAYLSDPRYALYRTECGDCHLAYPPSMLPGTSWEGVMGSLTDHFGDNAELDAATADRIGAFLADHAAGRVRGAYAERTWRATQGQTLPLRISQTDYFLGQHHEIPAKMVTGNADVGSFSRCEVCHGGAERGDFSEDRVRIPGFGPWDD